MRTWLPLLLACKAPGADPMPMMVEPDAFVPSTECTIENVLARFAGNEQLMNCGTVDSGQADAPFTAAHDCARAAEMAMQPYVVQWEIQGLDSRVASALVGMADGTGWSTYSFRYDGDPGGGGGENHPSTSIWQCAELVDAGSCADLHETLCLTCDRPTFVDRCSSP